MGVRCEGKEREVGEIEETLNSNGACGRWEYIPCLWEEVEWVQNGVCVVCVGLAT